MLRGATQGWLDLDPENMAAVFCANGKARTSILLACFLRFEGEEATALDAYKRVWAKRDPEQDPEEVSGPFCRCSCSPAVTRWWMKVCERFP